MIRMMLRTAHFIGDEKIEKKKSDKSIQSINCDQLNSVLKMYFQIPFGVFFLLNRFCGQCQRSQWSLGNAIHAK